MLAKIPKSSVCFAGNSTSHYWYIQHPFIHKFLIPRFQQYVTDEQSQVALDPFLFCQLIPHERIIWAGNMPKLANEFFYKGQSEVQGSQAKAITKTLRVYEPQTIITRPELRSLLEASPYLVTKQDVMEVFVRNLDALHNVIVIHKDIL